jgi:hypothetical protein
LLNITEIFSKEFLNLIFCLFFSPQGLMFQNF